MTYTVKGFGPLISLLPFEFGFVPTNSYLVVFFQDATMDACLRFDADDVSANPCELVKVCAEMSVTRSGDSAIVIAYDIAHVPQDHGRILAERLRRKEIPVHHRLEVHGERWRAEECHTGCCEPTWQPVDQPCDVAPVAEMVMRGVAPLDSREDALAILDRRDPVAGLALKRAIARLDEDPRSRHIEEGVTCAWCEFVSSDEVDERLLARVVVHLSDVFRRDEAIWSIVPELAGECGVVGKSFELAQGADFRPGRCQVKDDERCLYRLLEALPAIPESIRTTWLCFIALVRWRGGDHSGATMAALGALELEPTHTLARLCFTTLALRRPYREFCSVESASTSTQ